ncbi:BTB/POZ domain-containing protein 17 isoform X1 [Amia ocellicauda]|uniref:BTB/POZ domain-containing protein 17 isoform X1 n=1 Tax=Amia ocellicauda TaxID=2972642 RepID=UPI0034646DC4
MKKACITKAEKEMSAEGMDAKLPSKTLDNRLEIMEKLSQLFFSEDFCDVQLVINGKIFLNAHRVILALGSDVFKNMFSNGAWQESKQNTIQLTEDEFCEDHFEDFLRYFYTGTITIDADSFFPLYVLSDKYDVPEVKESCQNFAMDNVTRGPLNRAIIWWKHAAYMNFKELEEACSKFVALNMMSVTKSPDWLGLEPDHLCSLLDRPDLVVESEFELFRALKRWLSRHKSHTEKILKLVRFPLMSPEDIYDPSFPDSLPAEMKEAFSSNSVLIYQVNSLPIETIGLFHDVQSPAFTMRLYTSQTFGCSRTMNDPNCSSGESVEFFTTLFKAIVSWSVTTQQNHYRGHSTGTTQLTWTCRVKECNLTESSHSHQLSVLLHKWVGDKWLACRCKTFNIPHGQDMGIGNLLTEMERKEYLHKNTIYVHFIGKTQWKRP